MSEEKEAMKSSQKVTESKPEVTEKPTVYAAPHQFKGLSRAGQLLAWKQQFYGFAREEPA